ncbi:MAG: winged helix-turn-helix domain-containing protein [Clostridiales bacterium]|nr:winged helix-turn-helix domain-containing protein [Clostridiales bacterium]
MNVTIEQLRRFLLRRHGLLGVRSFSGADGLMLYIRQCGCIQFDPVDVCGKSHELALLARVGGFSHDMLHDLLYDQRRLIDFFDKNMCIMPVEDWPCLEHVRKWYRENSRSMEQVEQVAQQVLETVHQRGHVSADELGLEGRADWYWSGSSLSRVALETLYFRGDLVIHHKKGSIKSYALASDCLPHELLNAPYPFQDELERMRWQILRRISAVGALWNRASDAWLGVDGMKSEQRKLIFQRLEAEKLITPVNVEGLNTPLYLLSAEMDALQKAASAFTGKKQARLLAPLDCLMWDRRLIEAVFGFSYKWEIYTPAAKRQYSYYVLPVIYGERFAGRIEPVADRKEKILTIRHFWPEKGFRETAAFHKALDDELHLLAQFHGIETIEWT